MIIRVTDSYVREWQVLSKGSIIAKSATSHLDGHAITTKIDLELEIVGYFGYVDQNGCLMALGLFGFKH